MIKKIYTIPNCYRCEQMKKDNPEAEVIDLYSLPPEGRDMILDLCRQVGIYSAPICFDENDTVIIQ